MSNKLNNFHKEYKNIFNHEYYSLLSNYELLTEVGQLTLEHKLDKEDILNVLNNYDTSFDLHDFLKETYDDIVRREVDFDKSEKIRPSIEKILNDHNISKSELVDIIDEL